MNVPAVHVAHVPYKLPPGKHGAYETLWKQKTMELLAGVYPERESRRVIKVLDFGSGRGELMEMLRTAGFDAYGVDPDPKCVELSARYGRAVRGSVSDLHNHFPPKFFDAVCALHVLEHVECPLECVRRLMEFVKSYFVFSVPNLCTPVRMEYRRRPRIPVNEGHLYGWDYSHFRNFLERHCGLEIVGYAPDVVQIPHFSNLVWKLGLGEKLEVRWLPKLFPYLANSITVLCRIPGSRVGMD